MLFTHPFLSRLCNIDLISIYHPRSTASVPIHNELARLYNNNIWLMADGCDWEGGYGCRIVVIIPYSSTTDIIMFT